VHLELKDLRVLLDYQVQPEGWDHSVLRDQMEIRVPAVVLVARGHQVHLVHLETQEHKAYPDCKDLQARQVRQDFLEIKDPLDCLAVQARWELRDSVGHRELQAHLDNRVLLVYQGL